MRENNNKNISEPPSSLAALYFNQIWIAQMIDLDDIGEKYKGDKITITDSQDPYYNDTEYEVRYELRRLYYNKCAYCESKSFKPDVEHFRPKKGVSHDQSNTHGYYWLCFNWSNLLPACSGCNRENGKWSKFPVGDVRITNPPFDENLHLIDKKCIIKSGYLNSEKPLLLNPELEPPEKYLKLNWNGKLEGVDGVNGKGWNSINTYDLNRGNLIDARANIIDLIKGKIDSSLLLFREKELSGQGLKKALKIQFEFIVSNCSPVKVHSFVYLYIYENFNDFINVKFLTINQLEKDVIIKLFNEFRNN